MKKVIVFILALTMLFSSSSISFAADSYSEYFSEEREFIVTDNALDWSTYFFSDEENGYLYSRNVDTEEIKLIYAQNVTEHYLWEENIFCVVDGKNIVKITVTGQNPQTILTTNKDINQLYVNDDLIFYLMDNAIYRYHIDSKTTDCIVQDNYIYFFYPYSNFVIEWSDGSEYQEIKRIDNRLRGVTAINGYSYLDNTNNTRSATNVTIHNKSIPHNSYPTTKYYNVNKNNPCECHPYSNSCPHLADNEPCPYCKNYSLGNKSGWQCFGFGYEIYGYLWGSLPVRNNNVRIVSSEPAARKEFWSVPAGSHVRLKLKNSTGEHSIIVAKVTMNGIYSYEANWEYGCGISYEELSFGTLANRYEKIVFVDEGKHTFSTGYITNSSMHWRSCVTCGDKTSLGYHVYDSNMVCSVCNYRSNTSINSTEDVILY